MLIVDGEFFEMRFYPKKHVVIYVKGLCLEYYKKQVRIALDYIHSIEDKIIEMGLRPVSIVFKENKPVTIVAEEKDVFYVVRSNRYDKLYYPTKEIVQGASEENNLITYNIKTEYYQRTRNPIKALNSFIEKEKTKETRFTSVLGKPLYEILVSLGFRPELIVTVGDGIVGENWVTVKRNYYINVYLDKINTILETRKDIRGPIDKVDEIKSVLSILSLLGDIDDIRKQIILNHVKILIKWHYWSARYVVKIRNIEIVKESGAEFIEAILRKFLPKNSIEKFLMRRKYKMNKTRYLNNLIL